MVAEPSSSPEARQQHWDHVYATKAPMEVSWYQASPDVSLSLIASTGLGRSARLMDVGGGASTLVDALVASGHEAVTVVDIAPAALDAARERLGRQAEQVQWIVADVITWTPPSPVDIWHDRAVFHFLIEEVDRRSYLAALRNAVHMGGSVIIATFALKGPDKCSGLPVRRYSPDLLAAELGPDFTLAETAEDNHRTPWGTVQPFVYCRFRRRGI